MTYATMLVNLESGKTNAHLLQIAAPLAKRFQAHLIGFTACMPIQLLYGDGYIDSGVFEQDRLAIDRDIAATQAAFRKALVAEEEHADWRSVVTFAPLADSLAVEARSADLVVTAAPPHGGANAARQINLGDFIMQAGRPVLVVSPGPSQIALNHVMIAWQDTREARRATADALPLLKMSTSVSLVEIAPQANLASANARLADVAGWLAHHNVTAACLPLASHGEDAEQLQEAAQKHGADLIVAGAYGHSRVREWALGGVTRALLSRSARPIFVSH
jgi:nucleotide-binding universal stress UspA family protein